MPSCCFKRRVEEARALINRPSLIQSNVEESGQIEHIKGAPARVNKLYETCRKEQPDKSKEYCARVAWTIYNKLSKK